MCLKLTNADGPNKVTDANVTNAVHSRLHALRATQHTPRRLDPKARPANVSYAVRFKRPCNDTRRAEVCMVAHAFCNTHDPRAHTRREKPVRFLCAAKRDLALIVPAEGQQRPLIARFANRGIALCTDGAPYTSARR